jgi:hypothetical protein
MLADIFIGYNTPNAFGIYTQKIQIEAPRAPLRLNKNSFIGVLAQVRRMSA